MEISAEDINGFLAQVKKYRTLREGSSDFRSESAKDPSLDRHSFGKGFELGMYYAIDVLCGTEWVENHLTTEE